MELKTVPLEIPEGANLILGQTHFIKSVEDLYEALVNTVPQMKFGIAFNEASGPCLTRVDGNDEDLQSAGRANATAIAAGHIFVIVMRDGYPINVLGRIKDVPEVCSDLLRHREPRGSGGGGKRAGPRRARGDRRLPAEGRGDRGRRARAARFPAQNRIQTMIDSERAAVEDVLSRAQRGRHAGHGGAGGRSALLGVAGKMGPSLAHRARRACDAAGCKRIIGVARFSNPAARERTGGVGHRNDRHRSAGPRRADRLPDAPNVIYMAARKFGSTGAEASPGR